MFFVRVLAMVLILVSVLLVVPETRLGPSSDVHKSFLPERVSQPPVARLTPPSQPVNSVELAMFEPPSRSSLPGLEVVSSVEMMPAFDATFADPVEEPILRIAAAQAVDTPEVVGPDVADLDVVELDVAEPVVEEDVVVAETLGATSVVPEPESIPEAEIASVAPEVPTDSHRVTADFVNMRTGPSSRFDVVTVVKGGETADVMERQGNWAHVRMGESGIEGWVFARYLAPSNDA